MKGLNKGIQLIADFLRFLVRAIKEKDIERLMAAAPVAEIWLGEATQTVKGLPGVVKPGLAVSLLFGDPFKGSRMALQDLFTLFGRP